MQAMTMSSFTGWGIMGRVVTVGDQVEWDSAVAGTWSHKRGRVIEVVPAGCRPTRIRSGATRDHESYVVQVGNQVLWPAARVVRIR